MQGKGGPPPVEPTPPAPGPLILEPDGRIRISPPVMKKCVREAGHCRLWFDDSNNHLGIKLESTGGEDRRALEIRELPGGEREGLIDAARILARYAVELPAESLELPALWKKKQSFLQLSLGGVIADRTDIREVDTSAVKRVFDDYTPLD